MLMEMPGVSPAAPLMTDEQADEIVAQWSRSPRSSSPKSRPCSNDQGRNGHHARPAGRRRHGAAHRALAAFYAKTDVDAEIDSAVANAAEAIWNLAVQANQQCPSRASDGSTRCPTSGPAASRQRQSATSRRRSTRASSRKADGTKMLNTESLIAWVRGQLAQMLTDVEATDAGFVARWIPTPIAQNLERDHHPAHWAARPTGRHGRDAEPELGAAAGRCAGAAGRLKRCRTPSRRTTANTQDRWYAAVLKVTWPACWSPRSPRAWIRSPKTASTSPPTSPTAARSRRPSDASAVLTLDANDTVGVTVPAAPGGRHITHFRLYRSNSNSTSSAYQYVPNPTDEDGWPIGTLTITDDKKAAELQEPLPFAAVGRAAADLQGLVGGANGGMAGFRGNEFCPCVPYKGYAWPVALRITTETPIVGLGASGQNYFVGHARAAVRSSPAPTLDASRNQARTGASVRLAPLDRGHGRRASSMPRPTACAWPAPRVA
jgi:hypothetical protein